METKLQVALGVGGAMIVGLLLELIWGISDRWEATTLVLGVAVAVTLALMPSKEPDQRTARRQERERRNPVHRVASA